MTPSPNSCFALPPDCTHVKIVNSLNELVTTPIADGINALCWPRTLPGNFREVVEALPKGRDIVTVDTACLEGLSLSDAGRLPGRATRSDYWDAYAAVFPGKTHRSCGKHAGETDHV